MPRMRLAFPSAVPGLPKLREIPKAVPCIVWGVRLRAQALSAPLRVTPGTSRWPPSGSAFACNLGCAHP